MENNVESTEIMDDFVMALMDDEETADQPEADQPAPDTEGQEKPEEKQEPQEGEGTPEGGDEEKPVEEEKPTEPEGDAFELTHFGTVHTVKREEMIALAQKGMDYDRVREQRDGMNAEIQELRRFRDENREAMEFLSQSAKENGVSVEEYLDRSRIGRLMKQGMTKEAATERIAREKLEKKLADMQRREAASREEDAATRRRNEDIQNFLSRHPDVKPDSIPQEVWERVNKGEPLVSAYEAVADKRALNDANAEIERLKRELESEKKNNENRQKSIGGQRAAGESNDGRDPFLAAFLSDD